MFREQKGRLEQKAMVDHQDSLEHRVKVEVLAQLDHLVLKEIWDHQELL